MVGHHQKQLSEKLCILLDLRAEVVEYHYCSVFSIKFYCVLKGINVGNTLTFKREKAPSFPISVNLLF